MVRTLWTSVLLFLCCWGSSLTCTGRQIYQQRLPNGDRVTRNGSPWPAVGHTSASGGSQLNAFGAAFQAAGLQWTTQLCLEDSDQDGFSNGAELGDPDCAWSPAMGTTNLSSMVTHPGFGDSFPQVSTAAPTTANTTTSAPHETTPVSAEFVAVTTAATPAALSELLNNVVVMMLVAAANVTSLAPVTGVVRFSFTGPQAVDAQNALVHMTAEDRRVNLQLLTVNFATAAPTETPPLTTLAASATEDSSGLNPTAVALLSIFGVFLVAAGAVAAFGLWSRTRGPPKLKTSSHRSPSTRASVGKSLDGVQHPYADDEDIGNVDFGFSTVGEHDWQHADYQGHRDEPLLRVVDPHRHGPRTNHDGIGVQQSWTQRATNRGSPAQPQHHAMDDDLLLDEGFRPGMNDL